MQQLYTYDANESTLIFHSDLCQGWWGKLTREGKGLNSPIFQCQDKPTFRVKHGQSKCSIFLPLYYY